MARGRVFAVRAAPAKDGASFAGKASIGHHPGPRPGPGPSRLIPAEGAAAI